MIINRCTQCMQEISSYPCPHCGFTPSSYEAPHFALRPNHILNGRYLVGKMLGQGGFGITYIGFDLNLNRRVAIKEFYPFGAVNRTNTVSSTVLWSTDEKTQELRVGGLDSFKKEAAKMVRLEQIPQVVQVFDVFSENNTSYIVMEFAEGETLKAILQREGPMPWPQVQRIFYPIITAMGHVHKAGMVHRDLSPDNLMVDSRGRARILDLGAAKDLSAERDGPSVLVAKNGFSPLEQYGQRGGSGPWTDVYAMAATIYYTVTGHLPPSAIDRLENDCMNWDDPRLLQLPAPAIQALRHAMAVSSKQRTQDMTAFLRELSQKADTPSNVPHPDPIPVSSYPPSAVNPSSRVIPSSRVVPPSQQTMPVSQVPPFSQKQTPVSQVVSRNPVPAPPKRNTKWIPFAAGGGAVLVIAVLVILFTTSCIGGHHWKEATCTEPKTCTRCGQQEGLLAAHDYEPASCTAPKTCKTCGQTVGIALDHDFSGASCTETASCQRCGAVRDASGHSWVEATYTEPKTCSVCGATEGTMKGYLGTIQGTWGERISLDGAPSQSYKLEGPVTRCFHMELSFELERTDTSSSISCNYVGPWTVWIHNTASNTWESVAAFDVSGNVFDNTAQKSLQILHIPVDFSKDVSFDAVSVKPSNSQLRWSMEIFVEDVHVHLN